MINTNQKKINNPTPPEYANVFVLKTITVAVGIICLLLTGFVTWTVYSVSNHIAAYQNSLEVESVARKVAPIDFPTLERVIKIDEQKQKNQLTPITTDVFYNRIVTSTDILSLDVLPVEPVDSSHPSSSIRL